MAVTNKGYFFVLLEYDSPPHVESFNKLMYYSLKKGMTISDAEYFAKLYYYLYMGAYTSKNCEQKYEVKSYKIVDTIFIEVFDPNDKSLGMDKLLVIQFKDKKINNIEWKVK